MIAGSPDGISDDFVIEIKCPTHADTLNSYIRNDKPTEKYYAQMQMFLSGKKSVTFVLQTIISEQIIKWTLFVSILTQHILPQEMCIIYEYLGHSMST